MSQPSTAAAAAGLTESIPATLQIGSAAFQGDVVQQQLHAITKAQANSICQPLPGFKPLTWGVLFLAMVVCFKLGGSEPHTLVTVTEELGLIAAADPLVASNPVQISLALTQRWDQFNTWLLSLEVIQPPLSQQQKIEIVNSFFDHFWPVGMINALFSEIISKLAIDPVMTLQSSVDKLHAKKAAATDMPWRSQGQLLLDSIGSLSLQQAGGVSSLRPAALYFLTIVRIHLQAFHEKHCHREKHLVMLCADWMAYRSSQAVQAAISALYQLYQPDLVLVIWQSHMQQLLERVWRPFYDSLLSVPQLPAVNAVAPTELDGAQNCKLYYIMCWAVRKMLQWVHRKKGWTEEEHNALNALLYKDAAKEDFKQNWQVAKFCAGVDDGGLIYVKIELLHFVSRLDHLIRGCFTDIRTVNSYTFVQMRTMVQGSEQLRQYFGQKCRECGVQAGDDVLDNMYAMFTRKWMNMRSKELRTIFNDKVVAWKDMHKDPLRVVLKNTGAGNSSLQAGGPDLKQLAEADSDVIAHNILVAHVNIDGGKFLQSRRFPVILLRDMCRLYVVDPLPSSDCVKEEIVEVLIAKMCAVDAPSGLA